MGSKFFAHPLPPTGPLKKRVLKHKLGVPPPPQREGHGAEGGGPTLLREGPGIKSMGSSVGLERSSEKGKVKSSSLFPSIHNVGPCPLLAPLTHDAKQRVGGALKPSRIGLGRGAGGH